ncbi:unnamed protein product [Arctogadus glacialis]
MKDSTLRSSLGYFFSMWKRENKRTEGSNGGSPVSAAVGLIRQAWRDKGNRPSQCKSDSSESSQVLSALKLVSVRKALPLLRSASDVSHTGIQQALKSRVKLYHQQVPPIEGVRGSGGVHR